MMEEEVDLTDGSEMDDCPGDCRTDELAGAVVPSGNAQSDGIPVREKVFRLCTPLSQERLIGESSPVIINHHVVNESPLDSLTFLGTVECSERQEDLFLHRRLFGNRCGSAAEIVDPVTASELDSDSPVSQFSRRGGQIDAAENAEIAFGPLIRDSLKGIVAEPSHDSETIAAIREATRDFRAGEFATVSETTVDIVTVRSRVQVLE